MLMTMRCGRRKPKINNRNLRMVVLVKKNRIIMTQKRYTQKANEHSEARLIKSPRLKIVSSRCTLNSISLKRLLSAKSIKVRPISSPEKARVSYETKDNRQNNKAG